MAATISRLTFAMPPRPPNASVTRTTTVIVGDVRLRPNPLPNRSRLTPRTRDNSKVEVSRRPGKCEQPRRNLARSEDLEHQELELLLADEGRDVGPERPPVASLPDRLPRSDDVEGDPRPRVALEDVVPEAVTDARRLDREVEPDHVDDVERV